MIMLARDWFLLLFLASPLQQQQQQLHSCCCLIQPALYLGQITNQNQSPNKFSSSDILCDFVTLSGVCFVLFFFFLQPEKGSIFSYILTTNTDRQSYSAILPGVEALFFRTSNDTEWSPIFAELIVIVYKYLHVRSLAHSDGGAKSVTCHVR